jgi:hypothetical protein
MKEAVALQVAERERTGIASRIYISSIGPFDILAVELEGENLEEYEKGWAEYFASPEATQFLEKWYEVTETGGTNEIWRLVE